MNNLLSNIANSFAQWKSYKLQKTDSEFRKSKSLDLTSKISLKNFALVAGKTYFDEYTVTLEAINSGQQNIIIKTIEITDKLENIIHTFDITKQIRKVIIGDKVPSVFTANIKKTNTNLLYLIKENEVKIRIWDIEKKIYICNKIFNEIK